MEVSVEVVSVKSACAFAADGNYRVIVEDRMTAPEVEEELERTMCVSNNSMNKELRISIISLKVK